MNIRDFWPWLKAEFGWQTNIRLVILGKRYKIRLSEETQRQLDGLPEEAQAEIRAAMERISRNPYSGDRMELEEKAEG